MELNAETKKIPSILKGFNIADEVTFLEKRTNGLINTTYYVETEKQKFMLQKINTYVFKDPDALMGNISSVTHFLRKRIFESGGDPERETLHFLRTGDGRHYFRDDEENCWRLYYYVDASYTVNETEDTEMFGSAGSAFGRFMRRLNSYPAKDLQETIKDFHNTPKRYEAFEESIRKNLSGRKNNCIDEIEFVRQRKDVTEHLMKLYENGQIPTRVTHNDTKLNNVLFDENTHRGLCVIDLDTVMPGLSLYDFGDSIRSGANYAKEDEADLSKVGINLKLFKSYVEGYLNEIADCLTQCEIDNLVFSVKLMILECGMRFLTDYLDGDVYFKTTYKEHNLVRARNQFALVKDVEKHTDEMQKIVDDFFNRK